MVLDFGTLVRGDDIFEDEGMKTEVSAELLEALRVVETVDVDPGNPRGVPVRETLLDGGECLLFEPRVLEVEDRDPHLSAFSRQRTRRYRAVSLRFSGSSA